MHTAIAQSQARPHSHQHAGQRAPAAAQSAPAAQPKRYNPRHPERTLLYRTISENFETWLDLASAGQFDGQGDHHTPRTYVRQAFRKYLECGIFVNGFARARCGNCGHDYYVAFSCRVGAFRGDQCGAWFCRLCDAGMIRRCASAQKRHPKPCTMSAGLILPL
jgi:Transposase zinc-binding domain